MATFKTPFPTTKPPSLADSDLSPAAQDALISLEQAFFHWHRMVLKGELTGRLLAAGDFGIEPPLFHGLTAIARISAGVGRDAPEAPTVGSLAEEMNVDPSRASRIASELIARGFVARAAAQDDGRKSVLGLTGKGKDILTRMRDQKWGHFLRVFSTWSEDDITAFSRLFSRYADEILDGGEG